MTPVKLWFLLVLGCALPRVTAALERRLDPVQKQVAIFTQPPEHVPTSGLPDGPLLGNGDVGVALAGPVEAQQFYLGKNDFWRRNDPSVVGVGVVNLFLPALRGGSYRQEEDLAHAEVRGQFTKAQITLHTRSWVDANENLVITLLRCEDLGGLELSVTHGPQSAAGPSARQHDRPVPAAWEWGAGLPPLPMGGSASGGKPLALTWSSYLADRLPGKSRQVAVATRVWGGDARVEEDGTLRATFRPGETVALVSAVWSDLDAADPLKMATRRVANLHFRDLEGLARRHRRWWADYWARSFIEIPDQEIEKRWYAALYTLGCCSRAGKVAPGLWGNWITTDHPNWHGDFHLNYNFEAPYYIVYSANHADLSLPFYQAIGESVPNGRAMARRHGWAGVHFPVCIGPWGLSPENPDQDWGQRSDAAFAALNFIWMYQYTQNSDFLRTNAYPYLREVGDFWEGYLQEEHGRFVIRNDSIHEGSGPDQNPLLSLGLVRTLFKNLATMSQVLGVDATRRAHWEEIALRISDFPVQEREGQTVFRYSERGMDWCNDNTLGIHSIFPAGAIGLDSDPRLLEIARHTITVMNRWHDQNGFSSWYPACARVGYDPLILLAHLREECDHNSYPNLILHYHGGGIENVSGFLAVNEMLLQSHDGVIRLFPVWPKTQPARFGKLRAVGAFLISAEINNGQVGCVTIWSERGRPCTLQNPWPGRPVQLIRPGRPATVQPSRGDRLTFPTSVNETIQLRPA